MKTRELATEIFIRATSRMRPGIAEAEVTKMAGASAEWATIANGIFVQTFPEEKPAPAAPPEESSRVRPGVNRAEREIASRGSSAVEKPVPLHDAASRVVSREPDAG